MPTTSAAQPEAAASSRLYRAVWRWHFHAGLYVIPFLLMLAWGAFPAGKRDNVLLSDKTHLSLNGTGGKQVPWGLEQTPLPASGSAAGVSVLPSGTPLDLTGMVQLGLWNFAVNAVFCLAMVFLCVSGVLGLGAVPAVAFPLGGLAIALFAVIGFFLPPRLKQAGVQ